VSFASLALILTFPATVIAFALLPPTRAALLVLFAGVMFLPEQIEFDAPLIPPLDKHSITALCLMLVAGYAARKSIARALPGRGIDIFLILGLLLVSTGRVLTNRDTLKYGITTLYGLETSDIFSITVRTILGPGILFFLGRTMFRSTDNAKDLLRALVIAGLVYLPFAVVELRMSPQWHVWIYGFRQHSFAQSVRAGGYRPMCFMAHGLALAMLIVASVISAWSLVKGRISLGGIRPRLAAWILTILLLALHSVGAAVYGLVGILMIRVFRPKAVLRLVGVLAIIIATYPILRFTQVFPSQEIVDFSARFSQERAASLQFRFDNEDSLLERALERPWFGWGGHGRNRIFSAEGRDLSVTDGAWIVFIGYGGICGFVFQFGLLLYPVFVAQARIGRLGEVEQRLLATTALISIFYSLDLLPNGWFNDLPLFFSGALMGLSQGLSTQPQVPGNRLLVMQLLNALRRGSVRAQLRMR
jgi:hypothetical protein